VEEGSTSDMFAFSDSIPFINPKTNFAYSRSCIPFTHESTRRKGITDIKT